MNKFATTRTPTIGAIRSVARPALRERVIAKWLQNIRTGRLTVEFPAGGRWIFAAANAGPHATIRLNRFGVLLLRTALGGDTGFAEGYMEGEWDTPDLGAVLTLGAENMSALSPAVSQPRFVAAVNRFRHARRANTRRGSRRNIAAHYDLGNEFFSHWLDDTMTYSSALFDEPDLSLAEAQRRKYLRLARVLDLQPGDRVLEIGCGWGGFAGIAAAEFGCNVVGVTLSVEQAAYARERMARAGLADRVEIRIQDYRDVEGEFDKIASIEMFEAVGEENWPVYFEVVRQRMKRGGRAALQVITIDDKHFDIYRRNPDFIQRYIFPGGMLPSPLRLERTIAAAELQPADSFYFGQSYAETLRRWDRSFRQYWPKIEPLGFDQRFFRMWRYYLCYCRAGFKTGHIDVGQFVIGHT